MTDSASQAAAAFDAFLRALGVDEAEDPELVGTPERVAAFFGDLFAATHAPPPSVEPIVRPDPSVAADPVVVSRVPFHSMCVHHMVPFFGEISVAYVPDAHLIGFGSIPRLIRHFAARPQLQERLVEDLAAHLQAVLDPKGVLVVARARQLCVEMRGEKVQPEHTAVASRGSLSSGQSRAWVLSLMA